MKPNNVIVLALEPQELQQIAQLFDLAVKAGGIGVAEPALVLLKKMQEASQQQAAQNSQAANGEQHPN